MGMSGPGRRLVWLGFALAVLGALGVVVAGPGTRFEVWHFRTGLSLMRWAAYGALAGGGLALAGALARGGWAPGLAAIVIALAAAAGPWQFQRTARAVPPIHDITTDTESPPAFVDVLARRKGAPNPAEYAGAAIAEQQRAAYPDVQPLPLPVPPDAAFERALQAARDLGWEIVAAVPQEGRIEATDTTPWFGFEDDVVVRIRPQAGGSRVDVRSVSRVGRSDVGANAARIRRFMERLRRP